MTVNELMALQKAIKERVANLKNLRTQVATRDRYFAQVENKVTEPQYDVKKVDAKIVKLENFLFKADAAVKQSNAITEIKGLEVNVDELLSPLE